MAGLRDNPPKKELPDEPDVVKDINAWYAAYREALHRFDEAIMEGYNERDWSLAERLYEEDEELGEALFVENKKQLLQRYDERFSDGMTPGLFHTNQWEAFQDRGAKEHIAMAGATISTLEQEPENLADIYEVEFLPHTRDNPLVLPDYRSYCEEIADLYDELPEFDEDEAWRWDVLLESVENFYKKMSKQVDVQFVEGQPYDTAEQMRKEVNDTGILYISKEESEHPVWSREENERFRAVHDYVVHILPGKKGPGFSRRGEIRAYNLHRRLVPAEAVPALFTEVAGQACYANARGEFPVQKIAVFDDVDFYNVGKVKGQKVKRQPRLADRQMVPEARANPSDVVYKVAAFDPKKKKAYTEYGGKKLFFPTKVGKEIKGHFHTSRDKDFVLDYYTELYDDPDVLLTIRILDEDDILKEQGDEVVLSRGVVERVQQLVVAD